MWPKEEQDMEEMIYCQNTQELWKQNGQEEPCPRSDNEGRKLPMLVFKVNILSKNPVRKNIL